MTMLPSDTLVLAGTGKTGSRLATNVAKRGLRVRTAHATAPTSASTGMTQRPSGRPGGGRPPLPGRPVMRTDFADQVAAFLDLAQIAGVRHVTYLSAYGIDQAPPQVALRAVELDLNRRGAITHSILRPAWFMQNFSETFLKPVDGVITVPTADGAEAFIDAEDIAAVAAETLAVRMLMPAPPTRFTGSEAITVSEAAQIIAAVTGESVTAQRHRPRRVIPGTVAAGVPAEYGEMLRC